VALQIERVDCLRDNYVWLIRDSETGQTAVVDPAEFEPIRSRLFQLDWPLHFVVNTHHHADHVGANLRLQQAYGCVVVGSTDDAARIPGIEVVVREGEHWSLGKSVARVIDTPGHTLGHIAYWFGDSEALFCGDTLFALGCGRLFEGSAQQMWSSLSKLRNLPGQTRVYCAHEYTQANARFASHVDPYNKKLQKRICEIDWMRARNEATVPSLLQDELETNPFLRAHTETLALSVGLKSPHPVEVFSALRAMKDVF
jgi:hydroxyacylglutathione hydrolase